MSKISSSYGKGVELCVSWNQATGGHIPNNAVNAGGNTFVARAHHAGEFIPGKMCPGHQCCYVPYGGAEHSIPNYEVLVESGLHGGHSVEWHYASGSTIPKYAIVAGTNEGQPTYIARGNINGDVVVGKYYPPHGCAYFPWGGEEHKRDSAEVLCCTPKHM